MGVAQVDEPKRRVLITGRRGSDKRICFALGAVSGTAHFVVVPRSRGQSDQIGAPVIDLHVVADVNILEVLGDSHHLPGVVLAVGRQLTLQLIQLRPQLFVLVLELFRVGGRLLQLNRQQIQSLIENLNRHQPALVYGI